MAAESVAMAKAAKTEHLDAVAPDKQGAFLKAITTKNPLSLNTFQERGASIAAKLNAIRSNPDYQKLSPEQQAHVRAGVYDKYVVPSYNGFKVPLPNKDTWVKFTEKDQTFGRRTDSNRFFESEEEQFGEGIYQGLDRIGSGITLFGAKVTNRYFQELHGLATAFSAHLPERFQHTLSDVAEDAEAAWADKTTKRLINYENHHINGVNVWLNSHYRDSDIASLGETSGETIGSLPIYEAVGSAVGFAGGVGVEGPLQAGRIGKVGSLSYKLSATKLGKWTYNTLKTATDGYLGTLVASGNNKDAIAGGVGGGVISGVVGPIAEKIASYPLIKKWTASILSMGGKPFAEDLVASAMHEETVARHIVENKLEPQAQKIIAHLKDREVSDPLMHDLHKAEKITQGSIAQQMYGKPLRNLSKAQRRRVFNQRLKLIGEAAEEAPVHLPEFQKAEVEHQIEQQVEANPELGARFKKWEAEFGGSVVQTVTDNNIESVAAETGIKDSAATVKKLNKSQELLKRAKETSSSEEEYEPINGATAFHNLRKDVVSFFRNPTRGERLASDGTKIGARDKRAWNEILKSDNRKAFINVLKEADGNRIHFENDLHRMLFHYGNREGLDKLLKEKLLREIKKLAPKGIKEWDSKAIGMAADNTALHLYELAKSGRLVEEGNMFKSTNINPDWSPTKWQMQLHNENDDAELQKVTDALKRHPKAKKAAIDSMKALMSLKYQADNIQTYLELDAEIRKQALQYQLKEPTDGLSNKEYIAQRAEQDRAGIKPLSTPVERGARERNKLKDAATEYYKKRAGRSSLDGVD